MNKDGEKLPKLRREEAEALRAELTREWVFADMLELPARLSNVLMGVIAVAFLAAFFLGDMVLHQRLGLSIRYMSPVELSFLTGMKLNPQILDDGQWWRLITSTFTHMSFMHVGFNLYALYALGPLCERFYGPARFWILYMGSGVLASLASMAYTQAPSGGASGAIFGLFGALLVFGFKYRAELPARVSRQLTWGMLPWVVLNLAFGFIGGMRIDNAAHIGGLISGGVLALVLRSRYGGQRGVRDVAAVAIAAVLMLATLGSWGAWANEVRRCTASRDVFATQCYTQHAKALTAPERARRSAR